MPQLDTAMAQQAKLLHLLEASIAQGTSTLEERLTTQLQSLRAQGSTELSPSLLAQLVAARAKGSSQLDPKSREAPGAQRRVLDFC